MNSLIELRNALLILLRAGVVTRILFCIFKMSTDDENISSYKRKIRNVVIFEILAESAIQLKDVAMHYWG